MNKISLLLWLVETRSCYLHYVDKKERILIIAFSVSGNIYFSCLQIVGEANFGGVFVTKINEIYLCKICGNEVKVMNAGNGTLVCCGQPMALVSA
jgi:desulfoferrodoxin-like iron-binding protein